MGCEIESGLLLGMKKHSTVNVRNDFLLCQQVVALFSLSHCLAETEIPPFLLLSYNMCQ